MTTRNDVTNKKIMTGVNSDAYRDNYDRIFRKDKCPCCRRTDGTHPSGCSNQNPFAAARENGPYANPWANYMWFLGWRFVGSPGSRRWLKYDSVGKPEATQGSLIWDHDSAGYEEKS